MAQLEQKLFQLQFESVLTPLQFEAENGHSGVDNIRKQWEFRGNCNPHLENSHLKMGCLQMGHFETFHFQLN